jgi:hypothetical protein
VAVETDEGVVGGVAAIPAGEAEAGEGEEETTSDEEA